MTGPKARVIAGKYSRLNFPDIKKLLSSLIHEERLTALLILVKKYQNGDEVMQKKVFEFYVKNLKLVNNWDLVDLSASQILGAHLFGTSKKGFTLFNELSSSQNLWERRVSVVATLYFVRKGDFAPTLNIAKRLLGDKHDLIQKAVGWMLREVGKCELSVLETFLLEDSHYTKMPRTMLRYSIERFPVPKRKKYLSGSL